MKAIWKKGESTYSIVVRSTDLKIRLFFFLFPDKEPQPKEISEMDETLKLEGWTRVK